MSHQFLLSFVLYFFLVLFQSRAFYAVDLMLKWAEDGTLTAFGNRLVFTASHLINMKLFDGFVMDRGVALCKAIDAGGHEVVDLKYDTIRFTKISSRLFQLLCVT